MGECCTDNRFEMIAECKNRIIEATNIETAEDEMAVIDNVLFRFWQMGWLDKILTDTAPIVHGIWEHIGGYGYQYRCSKCIMCAEHKTPYCPNCGAKMDGGKEN